MLRLELTKYYDYVAQTMFMHYLIHARALHSIPCSNCGILYCAVYSYFVEFETESQHVCNFTTL